MPLSPLVSAVQTLRRVVGPHEADPPSDAELIERYALNRDDSAFETLLRRHGPTVYGVCRRVLGNSHDADDAFQAVFVILARRAATLREPRTVGNWLYGVAVRVATKARTLAAKRRLQLVAAAKSGVIDDPSDLADLHRVLDEELAKLPERYRAAVVLCDLNGKSRSVAAEELNVPEGTLATRLAKAREMLAARLRHRGVTLSVAGMTAALTTSANAAVPEELADLTMNAVQALPTASPAVIALAHDDFTTIHHSMMPLLFAGIATTIAVLGVGVVIAFPLTPPTPPAAAVPVNFHRNAPPEAEAHARGWKEAKALEQPGWLPGSVAHSPDGKALVVGGSDGHVCAYDTATGKKLWEYRGAGGHFAAVAFSKGVTEKDDGEQLALTFKDGIRLLDPKTGQVTATLDEPGSTPFAVGFFRDRPFRNAGKDYADRRLVFGNARSSVIKSWLEWPKFGTIRMNALGDGKKVPDAYAAPLALDPRGGPKTHAIMTGPMHSDTGKNVLWVYACGGPGGNNLLEGHKAIVTSAAWSADGNTAATGDRDGLVILWNTATWKEKSRVDLKDRVTALAITADGSRVAAAVVATTPDKANYRERVLVWNPAQENAPLPLPINGDKASGGPFLGLAGLTFSPDGKTLAAGFCNFDHLSKSGELVGKVRIWTLDEPKKPEPEKPVAQVWEDRIVVTDHDELVTAVAVSPNGHRMASAGADGTVHVRNAKTLKTLFTVKGAPNAAIAFSPDNTMLAVTQPGGATFHSTVDGKMLGSFTDERDPPRALAFSGDGNQLAASDGRTVSKTAVLAVLGDKPPAAKPNAKATTSGRAAVVWARNEQHILFLHTSKDVSEVRVWPQDKFSPAKLTGHTGPVQCVAVSTDGKTVATGGSDTSVILYETSTLKELRRVHLGGHNGNSTIYAVAFSPDNKTLAASVQFEDGKGATRIVFVDVATGAEVGFKIHNTVVPASSLAYSPDGMTLYAVYGWEPPGQPVTPDVRKAEGGLLAFDRDPK